MIRVPIYGVIWTDAGFDRDNDMHCSPLSPGLDVGFIMSKDKKQIVTASEMFHDGHSRHLMAIPFPTVRKVIKIGVLELPKEFTSKPKI